MEQRLDGHAVLVTGASQGLGRAIALEMAARGAAVVLAARREGRLAAGATRGEASGGPALPVASDVAAADGITALVDAATASFGKVDTVVNNAADEGPIAPFLEQNERVLARSLEVNLLAVWRL